MMPRNQGYEPPHTDGRLPISEKEEIARAALRSLADPASTAPVLNSSSGVALPLPHDASLPLPPPFAASDRPQLPTPSTRLPLDPGRHLPAPMEVSTSSHSAMVTTPPAPMNIDADRPEPQTIGMAAANGGDNPASYFGDHYMTCSPTSSPRASAASIAPLAPPVPLASSAQRTVDQHPAIASHFAPPPPPRLPSPHTSLSRSQSFSAASSLARVREHALRCAATALRMEPDEARSILIQALPAHRAASLSPTAATASALYRRAAAIPLESFNPDFVREVIDAFHYEEERLLSDARSREAYVSGDRISGPSDTRPLPPPGQAWADTVPRPERDPVWRRGTRAPAARRSVDGWEARPVQRHASLDSGAYPDALPNRQYPTHEDTTQYLHHGYATVSGGDASKSSPLAPPRPESPSPFAYDPHRRPSEPQYQTSEREPMPVIDSQVRGLRASFGSAEDRQLHRFRDGARHSVGWGMASPLGGSGSPAATSPGAASNWRVPDDYRRAYSRKVRSIDDYLETSSRQHGGSHAQSQSGRNPGLAQTQSGSGHEALVETAAADRLKMRPRPSPQTLTSQFGQSAVLPQSVLQPVSLPPSPAFPLVSSKSPVSSDALHHTFGQRRSPVSRASVAPTSPSTVSSASVAGMTPSPSPMLGASRPVVSTLTDEPMRSADPPSDANGSARRGVSSGRERSEDAPAEMARARVANMQIEDLNGDGDSLSNTSKASSLANAVSRSSSVVDRRSVTPSGTELSHSEIMQRLKQKVKSRLAAKGRGEDPDKPAGNGRSKLSRPIASTKRSQASSSSKSIASTLAGNSANSGVAARDRKSVTGKGTTSSMSSISSLKALRSAGAQNRAAGQKLGNKARKLSTSASPSTSSLGSAAAATSATTAPPRTDTPPTSIAAALLSPTDSPTPTEAARNVAAARASQSPEDADTTTVETASGQVLPGELPGAGQMNAASATKQQNTMSGIDSLLQAAASSDPTETNSAIA
ncbi:hypothetical protein BCV70DRAFT_206774 [Testicularia cyperi]|uniref:Uncharacterized protein n=1 Tax=Testicularia cyperi TaxID=1882483 RepID=A0A317XNB7_9BASI|nr:hypothetical protein BCV70DRAFT_206774 [Testicularia cyperi]